MLAGSGRHGKNNTWFIGLTVSELMEAWMKIMLESGDETGSLLPDKESQEFAIE